MWVFTVTRSFCIEFYEALGDPVQIREFDRFTISTQSEVKLEPIVIHLYAFSRVFRQLHVFRVLIGSLYRLFPL